MAIEVTIPASGESVTSANVARWHRKNGESVKRGETLVTLETDKVSNELEAAADGILEIVTAEGEEVPIGTVIARIVETQAATAPTSAPTEPAATTTPSAPASSASVSPLSPTSHPAAAAVEIKVPASGESITSANVAAWKKQDGDPVHTGEILVVLETDKVSNEIESPCDGILKVLVAEGEEVRVGTVIGKVEPSAIGSESKPALTPSAPQAAPAVEPARPLATPTATTPAPSAPTPQKPAEKAAPAQVTAPAKAPVDESRVTRRKMSMLRRKIATHLVNAQQTAAILTTFNEVDMSAIMDMRKSVQDEFVKKHGVKLGFMSFFVKAVTQALKDVPSINARIDGNDIIENHFYDIGVAIGTEKGLVVPVLRDCDTKSFAEIEQDIIEYANKAREGKMLIEDLQGGVFSISNGGTYGSLLSTPILNPPQSGILGMHTIQQRPVAVNNQVVIRPMMYLALSYDHRLVDGKEAVTFLIRIKNLLESPARLMLEV
ncbi:MAG: dihydrolipoyllysine-residue succinyltransferase [Luteolibacter sp.]